MSISYPAPLVAVGGARTGIAPVNLLDVEDVNGNLYYWSDRPIKAPTVLPGSNLPANLAPPVPVPAGQAVAWVKPTVVSTFGNPTPDYTSLSGWSQSAVATSDGGTIKKGGNDFASTQWVGLHWTGFVLPPLPPGAVVQSIYQVFLVAGLADQLGLSVQSNQFGGSSQDIAPPGTGNYSIEHVRGPATWVNWGGGAGSNPPASWMNALYLEAQYQTSGGYGGGNDQATFTFIGLAVYYSTGGSLLDQYEPWLLSVPQFTFHRSLQTDVGKFVLQNLSGDTVSRDFEKIMRRSALEGAMFVWRLWQPDAQAAWLEVHGTLTVDDIGVATVSLKGSQITDPARSDTVECFAEGCQLTWGLARCGSTQATECAYSLQTCQVVPRIMAFPNNYEKNYGESLASISQQNVNRQRRI